MRAATSLAVIVGLMAWNTPGRAQDAAAQRATLADAADQPTAPVVIDGVSLFRVRGVSAYPAEQRAAAIAGRIKDVASDRDVPADSLVVLETPLASNVAAAGRRVLSVVDADAQLEGVGRQVLAEAYRQSIVDAIRRFRNDREAGVLGRDLAKALAATLALVLGIWLGRKILSRLRQTLDRRYRERIRDVQFRTIEIVRAEHLW